MLLIGTMAISMCACGGKGDGGNSDADLKVTAGTPTYEDNKQIELSAYCGPRRGGYRWYNDVLGAWKEDPEGGWDSFIDEKNFQDFIDCGFTYLMAEKDAPYEANQKFEDMELKHYMDLAEKMNIPVLVYSGTLEQMTSTGDPRLTDDQKAFLDRMVKDLSAYKTFKGFTFRDEPKAGMEKSFKVVKEYLDSLKPGLCYYTSMLPIYADDLTVYSKENTTDREAAYKDYVNMFSDAIGEFGYDSYPLFVDPVHNATYVRDDWFQNLRIVAENAKEKDYDMTLTVQSMSEGIPDGEDTTVHKYLPTKKSQITYQVYSALAYGAKAINYYTYWQHWQNTDTFTIYSSMVNYPEKNGQEAVKTEAYYAVKEANEEIKKFDHVFLNFDWEGTMAVTDENKTMSNLIRQAGDYKSPRIDSVTATEETVIGCLKDDKGYDGYMIVNATDPGQDIPNKVTIKFKKATKAMIYVHGEEQTVDLKDGSYTFELASGDGVFAIPIQ